LNLSVRFEIEEKLNRYFCRLGDDLSEGKDQSVLRRIFKRGEGWAKPNDGSNVEVTLKGTHENRVFDERTVKFIVGEGFLKNIPEGFVLFKLFNSIYFHYFSLEHAITRMTKGEHSQIKLKSKATIGLEKFNIPKNSPVEYIVTLNNFEKVSLRKKIR